MNIDAIRPETWLLIFVVVAAAGIVVLAMIATLLKIRNNKLRVTLAALRARYEEDQRRLTPAPPVAAPPVAAPPAAAPEVAAPMETPAPQDSDAGDRDLAIHHAGERAIDFASRQGLRRHPEPPPESSPKLDEINHRDALSEWLNKRAAARAPQKTAPSPEPTVEPDCEPEKAVAEPTRDEPARDEPSRDREEAVVQPRADEPKQSTVVIDESLWESILGQSPARFEVIQGMTTGLPAGLHDEAVLSRLLESNNPFHGLAVAVGVSLNNGRAVSRDLMLHIRQLVRSLLRDGDFACQTGDDEFLLLCPGKQGAEAERRLSDISACLWDFQLRGVGNFSILFNTGDARVEEEEPLGDAAAAASVRLQQARRARKLVSLASVPSRKTASAAV